MIVCYGKNHGWTGQITFGGTSERQLGNEVQAILEAKCNEAGWQFFFVKGETTDQAKQISTFITNLGGKDTFVSLQIHMNASSPPGIDMFYTKGSQISYNLSVKLVENMKALGMPVAAARYWQIPDSDPQNPGVDRFPSLTFVRECPSPTVLIEAGLTTDPAFAKWIDVPDNRANLASCIFQAIVDWLSEIKGGWVEDATALWGTL